ncbi:enoyl-CoA hydratase/isomerase family protein [Nonomuraea sp. NBC_01738]|uniref:enoyl-CoA hydratase/isomerase family protein n=1 Tax=Nonomuraea sp. NBC_01738 TaxID=2976003 RepID=UPI002E116A06|nr:enoyl-CoA hydratase/isomerase family protein [Nonomuraea sp. NBC_01738]
METLIVQERDDRVVVRLHRPQARNAVNAVMVAELHEVCAELEARPRPLLLTGGDGFFAAGADIAELAARGREQALQGINSTLFERVRRLPMPTVAAVDGYALGGGAELAYACDLRVGSDRVRFGNPEPGLGIIAGAGACWRLTELVGEPLAKLVLLAGHVIHGPEALSSRLVASLHAPADLDGAAHALIDRMGAMSATALRLTKLVLDAPPGAHPVADHLAQAVLFEDPDKQARMRKFLDRRAT